MKLKKIAMCIMVSVILGTFAGCKDTQAEDVTKNPKENQHGGTIVVPISDDLKVMNRDFSNTSDAILTTNIFYSPLYTYKAGNIKTYLAKDVDFRDHKVMTIKLREGLKWHDGNAVTSEDIVFTINAILDESQKSPLRRYLIIDGEPVKAVVKDEFTAEITLPVEVPSFLYEMSNVIPIPKHIYEGKGAIMEYSKNNNPIGSGPFKLKEWKKGDSITFERYEDYFGGEPKAESIVLKVIPKSEDREAALKNGEITLMRGNLDQFQRAKSSKEFQTFTSDSGRLNYILFNEDFDYMKNEDFRKALSYALNRKEIIKSAYGGEVSNEAKSILIPEADFYTEDVEGYDYNLNRAKEELEESKANIKNIKMGYNTESFAHKEYALSIQGQLKALNIDVDIIPYDNNSFYKEIFKENSECAMYITGYNLGLEPNDYRYMYETGSVYNISGYSDKDIDKLWDLGFKERDDETRKDIYEKIQREIADDAPIYTIDYEANLMIAQRNLKGLDEAMQSGSQPMFGDWSKLYLR